MDSYQARCINPKTGRDSPYVNSVPYAKDKVSEYFLRKMGY